MIDGIDVNKTCILLSNHVDYATCLQCCRVYTAPETAQCGHKLCHLCWKTRTTCPSCGKKIEKKQLKLNMPMKIISDHINEMVSVFEKVSGVKIDQLSDSDIPVTNVEETTKDKHVKEWLACSDNHFSAPAYTISQQSSVQEILPPIEVSGSKIQIHSELIKHSSSSNVVCAEPPPQDDWDAIEAAVETKDHAIGPMDIEPFEIEDIEYTTAKPRRSTRKKDHDEQALQLAKGIENNINNSNKSELETDKKLEKVKQNWTNVKKMRKEFSKLNKKNRSKLNVSIEMCKKTQSTISKQVNCLTDNPEQQYAIDEDTPVIDKEINEKSSSKSDMTEKVHKSLENINETIDKTNDKELIPPKEKISVREIAIQAQETDVSQKRIYDNCNKVPFVMKSVLNKEQCLSSKNHTVTVNNINETNLTNNSNDDDIHITIRIGTVVTNITINKNRNDVNLKVNEDREIQTCFEQIIPLQKEVLNKEPNVQECGDNAFVNLIRPPEIKASEKSVSNNKHTASAETVSMQCKITDSVEKELSKAMECDEVEQQKDSIHIAATQKILVEDKIEEEKENITDDMDIFDSCSAREVAVKDLTSNKDSQSEIFSTKNNEKIPRTVDKRKNSQDNQNPIKKAKLAENEGNENINVLDNSEPMNYDALMSQVFANIDADLQESKKKKIIVNDTPKDSHSQVHIEKSNVNNKNSENIFSTIGNPNPNVPGPETQKNIDNLLTPGMCLEDSCHPSEVEVMATPLQEYDSDKSVVEETPQKRSSIAIISNKSSSVNKSLQGKHSVEKLPPENSRRSDTPTNENHKESEDIQSIINLTDTVRESDKAPDIVSSQVKRKPSLETPITINKFVDQIKHKSTPVARKSLNFAINDVDDDDDMTLCPTLNIAKNTQEKEIMSQAFAAPTPVRKPFQAQNVAGDNMQNNICIAGSCLTGTELMNLKVMCYKRKWTFVEKYTHDLTHLVVGVDEYNYSQRSVKYMCALAAGKWIVSYKWVQKCMDTNSKANEMPFEVLDSTGDSGPMKSRLAKRKVFEGLTFYCLPPFSVLDLETLKYMIVSSGGRVVNNLSEAKVSGDSPSLVLAEPINTQENKFMYLAMQNGVVPVNYEWVLNCLGSYSICSIIDLLLIPPSLLPSASRRWPHELMVIDD